MKIAIIAVALVLAGGFYIGSEVSTAYHTVHTALHVGSTS